MNRCETVSSHHRNALSPSVAGVSSVEPEKLDGENEPKGGPPHPGAVRALILAGCLLFVGLPAAAEGEGGEEEPLSEECRAFREDAGADLGEVLRAGCEPTLAQMSRLMDNPLGNVAMLFTQFDMYRMTNDEVTGLDAELQYNYTYSGRY